MDKAQPVVLDVDVLYPFAAGFVRCVHIDGGYQLTQCIAVQFFNTDIRPLFALWAARIWTNTTRNLVVVCPAAFLRVMRWLNCLIEPDDNEKKKLLAQIENRLSTIARQGRAFGIHLILATQRPDANVLPGQIKNNMDFRVCGRAGNVLSQIILDNTSAAEQIPKDARGRFITGDGTVFQGYLFDEGQL